MFILIDYPQAVKEIYTFNQQCKANTWQNHIHLNMKDNIQSFILNGTGSVEDACEKYHKQGPLLLGTIMLIIIWLLFMTRQNCWEGRLNNH